MKLSPRYRDALTFALDLHRKQERKGSGVPYFAHLMGVSSLALEYGGDEDEAIAALLHDAAKDQGGRQILGDIGARFGERVATIVECARTPWTIPNRPGDRERKPISGICAWRIGVCSSSPPATNSIMPARS